jgi:hypothetical protein
VFNAFYRTLPADVVARRARASLDSLL